MPSYFIGELSETRLFDLVKPLLDGKKSGMISIKGREYSEIHIEGGKIIHAWTNYNTCLLYTSDAADDLLCVDLGGRRIIKKKTTSPNSSTRMPPATHIIRQRHNNVLHPPNQS